MSLLKTRKGLLGQFIIFGVLPAVSVVALVIGINGARTYTMLDRSAEQTAIAEASAIAGEIEAWNVEATAIVSVLSRATDYGLFGNRADSLKMMRQVMEAYPELEACYFMYEPNADGNDATALAAQRRGAAGALPASALDANGRFTPYLYRDNAHGREIALKPSVDDDKNQYYQGPKQRFARTRSRDIELTEPYSYEGVFMTECTQALVVDGRFAGIIGVDRGLDLLVKRIQAIATRDGLNIMLLTGKGKFIAAAIGEPNADGALLRAYAGTAAQSLDKTPWSGTLPDLLQGAQDFQSAHLRNPITGDTTLHVRNRVAIGGWEVVVEVPNERLSSQVNSAALTNVMVGLAGAVLMTVLLVRMANKLARRIGEAADAARDVADGDLTRIYPVQGSDEASMLMGSMNDMTTRLNGLVSQVRGVTLSITGTATEMAGSSRQQEEVAQGFGASSAEIAAAVRQITTTGAELVRKMEQLSAAASESAQHAAQGREGLHGMGQTMQQLAAATGNVAERLAAINEKASSINAIVDTITKVADQTNLLSVNAAIEAEKAGESGRGFLVVAREIRRLADQTAAATLDIETTVRQMQTAVSGGVMEMDRFSEQVRRGVENVGDVGQRLTQVIDRVGSVESRFGEVTEGMQSQVQGADQIRQAMDALAQNASRAREATGEFALAASTLQESLTQLRAAVNLFRLREGS